MIFIADRQAGHYNELKKLLSVIGAKRMLADEMAAFVLNGERGKIDLSKSLDKDFLESYGFFAMEI